MAPLAPPDSRGLTILLVDDHRLMREGVRRILESAEGLDIVGETDDGHEALALLGRRPARVAVIDLSMPGLSGIPLVRRIRHDHPQTAVLVLSMHSEEEYAMRALRGGASGYLTKDSAAEELVQAVRKVAGGGCYLSRGMAERVALSLTQGDEGPRHGQLSDREYEIFRMIVAGKRMTDIAQALHLSIKTVSTHKSRILQKMRLDGTASLIRYGLQHRLFGDNPTATPHGIPEPVRLPAEPASHPQSQLQF